MQQLSRAEGDFFCRLGTDNCFSRFEVETKLCENNGIALTLHNNQRLCTTLRPGRGAPFPGPLSLEVDNTRLGGRR
jgi:hypothetical protein